MTAAKRKKTAMTLIRKFLHLLLKGIKNVLNEIKECDQNHLNLDRFLNSFEFFSRLPLKTTCLPILLHSIAVSVCHSAGCLSLSVYVSAHFISCRHYEF